MVDFDVVELPEADHVETGETAPEFTRPLVTTEFWEDRSLSSLLENGPVLLVAYPMDGAFPATYVWNEIADRGWTDAIDVVGIGISTPYEHGTLLEERDVDARLFSDPGAEVLEEYGVTNDLDGMAGIVDARPAVFAIDEDRTVRYAWVAAEHPEFPPYDAIGEAVDDLTA
ncbi:Peroxiredoxin [Halopenitus malekzadehii]|uniref:Peroxiredoxin n=1 Tax=Halopenitus malekzadehii TaxID=1267564 RepID=A0A1H6HV70_9EURY|nr:redoxin domain-containing protein [Halopenitus malekzadehii]SEH38157.1 Peroxiredoxin [Halopenitus malekzadehii]